jgi:hypothetical protein
MFPRAVGCRVFGDHGGLGFGRQVIAEQTRDSGLQPESGGGVLQGAFPDGDDVPAEFAELLFVAGVAEWVAEDLGLPPCAARFRQAEVRAIRMAVPEATADGNVPSSGCQRLLDGSGDFGAVGRLLRLEAGERFAILADEKLAEVPFHLAGKSASLTC